MKRAVAESINAAVDGRYTPSHPALGPGLCGRDSYISRTLPKGTLFMITWAMLAIWAGVRVNSP